MSNDDWYNRNLKTDWIQPFTWIHLSFNKFVSHFGTIKHPCTLQTQCVRWIFYSCRRCAFAMRRENRKPITDGCAGVKSIFKSQRFLFKYCLMYLAESINQLVAVCHWTSPHRFIKHDTPSAYHRIADGRESGATQLCLLECPADPEISADESVDSDATTAHQGMQMHRSPDASWSNRLRSVVRIYAAYCDAGFEHV